MNEEVLKAKKEFYKRWWFWVLAVIIFFIIIGSDGNTSQKPTTQMINVSEKQIPTTSPVVVRTERCKAVETPISYSVLEERDRESDVKGIPIHECYILLDKVAPSIAELTSLATALGKDVENIEFEIFDARAAYTVNKRYKEILARNGKDSEISKSDWVIWDVHYLARYLKANTHRRNNYFWTISDIYSEQKNVQINN